MGIANLVVFAQVLLFIVIFVFSFFVYVPISASLGDFKGHCLLYADGVWVQNQTSEGPPQLDDVKWGSDGSCNFPIFVGIVSMLLGLFYSVWKSIHLFKGTDSSWLGAFVTCLLCSVVCVMMFSSALMISIGFDQWCSLLHQPLSAINSCENGQYIPFAEKLGIDTRNYFIQMQVSQFGAWSSWFCWVALTMLSIIKIYRYSKQEAFLTSMNRERERLIQRMGPSQENV